MASLETRVLGRTGLEVTRLGYGAMELAFNAELTPADAHKVLNQVIDSGITFVDTSPDYGASEELIGQAISHLSAAIERVSPRALASSGTRSSFRKQSGGVLRMRRVTPCLTISTSQRIGQSLSRAAIPAAQALALKRTEAATSGIPRL